MVDTQPLDKVIEELNPNDTETKESSEHFKKLPGDEDILDLEPLDSGDKVKFNSRTASATSPTKQGGVDESAILQLNQKDTNTSLRPIEVNTNPLFA